MTAQQKKYLVWLKKALKVTTLKGGWNKFSEFIKDENKEICDFYIYRNGFKVVWLDKTAKDYMVRPAKN